MQSTAMSKQSRRNRDNQTLTNSSDMHCSAELSASAPSGSIHASMDTCRHMLWIHEAALDGNIRDQSVDGDIYSLYDCYM